MNAHALVSAAGLDQALGTAIVGLQDDGGVTMPGQQSGTEFASQAEAETSVVHLTITLSSYSSASQAMQAYSMGGQGQPLAGVGDQANYQPSGKLGQACGDFGPDVAVGEQAQCEGLLRIRGILSGTGAVTVLKGAQVLTVAPDFSAGGSAQLAQLLSSSMPSWAAVGPLVKAVSIDAPQAAARALVSKTTGQPATTTYYQLPAGGLNPCQVSPNALQATLNVMVTADFGSALQAHQTECDYTIDGNPYTVDIETSQQAAAAVPPDDLQASYTSDSNQAAYKKTVDLGDGLVLQISASGGELSTFEELITGLTNLSTASYSEPGAMFLADSQPTTVKVTVTPVRARSGGEVPTSNHCKGLANGATTGVAQGQKNWQDKKNQAGNIINDACKNWDAGGP